MDNKKSPEEKAGGAKGAAADALARAAWKAVEDGDAQMLRAALEAGVHPDTVYGPDSLLKRSVQKGDLDCARALLDAGADPNFTGRGKSAPLMAAASKADGNLARLLLERGAKIFRSDAEVDPVCAAAHFGSEGALGHLLPALSKIEGGQLDLHEPAYFALGSEKYGALGVLLDYARQDEALEELLCEALRSAWARLGFFFLEKLDLSRIGKDGRCLALRALDSSPGEPLAGELRAAAASFERGELGKAAGPAPAAKGAKGRSI